MRGRIVLSSSRLKEKLIGRKFTWKDEPVELKEERGLNGKILNLVKQMSEDEKQSLLTYIKRQYMLEEKTGMLRDDIRDRVFEIIKLLFADDSFEVQEHFNFIDLTMDAKDVTELSDALSREFELEDIPFAEVMEWQRIKDIIRR